MKANIRLTQAAVNALKPASKQYDIFDAQVPGFGVRISPGGAKSYCMLYRLHGRSKRVTIGRVEILTLNAARDLAREIAVKARQGIEWKAERRTYSDEAEPGQDFSSIAANFISHIRGRLSSAKEAEQMMNRIFISRWGKKKIGEVTRREVVGALDEIGTDSGRSAANHAFALIRRFFNWCVERGLLSETPCRGLKSPFRNVSRDRVLTKPELQQIWLAAEQMDYPFGFFIQVLMLTGQRRNEVAKLRWSHLDFDKCLWVQPAASNKARRLHIVPLSPSVIELLKSLPRLHEDLVFPARGGNNGISGFSKWKHQLDDLSGTSEWRLHDIRRTVTTGMAELKVPYNVADLILNHRSSALSGVAGIYNRHEYLDERREALEKWAKHVSQLVQQARAGSEAAAEIAQA